MSIGILVHGRHLDTYKWEDLLLGNPHQFGSLPMLVYVILTRGIDSIDTILFGTGASQKEGLRESEYTKQFFIHHFDHILSFPSIANHPNMPADQISFKDSIISKILCDTQSQNTLQELTFATHTFVKCSEVIHITSPSHAPRCIKISGILTEQGVLPPTQIWSLIKDHTPYPHTSVSDVTIIEPPHRGDDPFLTESLRPNEIFQRFYNIKDHSQKIKVLKQINELLE